MSTTETQKLKIGLVIGSIRVPRRGESVGQWVLSRTQTEQAQQEFSDVEWQVLDLVDYDLPPLTRIDQAKEPDAPEPLARWRDDVESCDAFVFITPEYNRAAPGYFKNAYDLLDTEWKNKPIAFVSYGGVGGARAVDAWRRSIAAYDMHSIGRQITLFSRHDFDGVQLLESDRRDTSLHRVLTSLVELTRALRRSTE